MQLFQNLAHTFRFFGPSIGLFKFSINASPHAVLAFYFSTDYFYCNVPKQKATSSR